ncbi:MAG: UDP-glucose 4-epimerase [Chlamydiia bacterium]|nr:UDP-glucose 4-epimerase [Chlamydiia bacterium]MCH9616241.1 UDP-glucose 4-epimerase [Chlamydiia bacterium]MCH9629773.1 UDP-glucose 4-epimerase [Chlamydiia bacterium]
MNKKALVTGGAGFLGSFLCRRLIEKDYQVICLDNLLTGSKSNVEALMDHPNFKLVLQDVCDPFSFEVDEIYNLACPASPIHYQNDPIKTTRTNVYGAMNVLELARKTGAKVFQASTSEVYGDPKEHPQTENYWGYVNPNGMRSCYDEGKRCAETLCFDFHRQYGVKVRIGRIFNTFGPRMHPNDGRVVSNFIVQALQAAPITIYGDGTQTRSFCFVEDLIAGILAFMDEDIDVVGPINLGNPNEFTMLKLAEEIIDLTGTKSKVVYENLPSDDPKQRRPDITVAQSVLGWTPHIQLRSGLQQTIDYFSLVI